ncbi:MAG: phosphopyruvate hydratase [Lachnospiraceae bacterium]|nr:phosphopyruvate hydratase [Lachnospiraceae bacterium]
MNGTITDIEAKEVLDSRGFPTVEAIVTINHTIKGKAMVPSGASTGKYEALELRDKQSRYLGKGVLGVVKNINEVIAPAMIGMNALNQKEIDYKMISIDGSKNKANLGANAILAVSLAVAHAAANYIGIPLYRYLGGMNAATLPIPMMNVINGGVHAKSSGLDVQEFMIVPIGAANMREAVRMCAETYHTLKKLLSEKNLAVSVGDEGGFAPALDKNEEALDLLMLAIREAGFEPGKDFKIALDAAASEWKGMRTGDYYLPKASRNYSTEKLIEYWKELCAHYPIYSIEDPLDEEDWDGWKKITAELGKKIQLVGDDLFVTNSDRLKKGMEEKCANAILIKLNQIGTLTETLETIRLARRHGYNVIISHRSGETEDTTIADLSVALNAGQIKTGAPARSERVAKYNRLMEIADDLS